MIDELAETIRRNTELQMENMVLKNQAQLFSAMIDYFPGGVVLTDNKLQVLICNTRLREMLEYPPELFAYGYPNLRELFRFNATRGEYGPGDIDTIVNQKLELVAKGEAHVFERVRPNGRTIEVRGLPLPGGGFVTSYTDVTESGRVHSKASPAVDWAN